MAHVVVAGAGLGGALMALYLARAGHDVEIFERRADPRRAQTGRGRSINLALSTRGLGALAGAGLGETVLAQAIAMRGRIVHAVDGRTVFQPYGTEVDQVIRSVSRAALNALLLDACEQQGRVALHFSQRCIDLDLEAPALVVEEDASGRRRRVETAAVIGADGAYSAVRARLQRLDRFDYAQNFLSHGYKELTLPATDDGGFRLEPHALHIWPRGGSMMIALPNIDGTFTCTLFWPFDGANGFAALRDAAEVREHFGRYYADAVPHLPTLVEEYFANPTSPLVTIRCWPWHHDRVVLLGDASHAIVPFYGQGANAAFEDCVVMDDCLRRHGGDFAAAFAEFGQARKVHTDALADLALENFIEMRDRVASPVFRLRKRVERTLHRLLPGWFVPLYTLVTFTSTPYAQARQRAERQWRIVTAAALLVLLALVVVVAVLV